jgi:hypothetical protein
MVGPLHLREPGSSRMLRGCRLEATLKALQAQGNAQGTAGSRKEKKSIFQLPNDANLLWSWLRSHVTAGQGKVMAVCDNKYLVLQAPFMNANE